MCMGSRIKSERVCLMFPDMPEDRRIRRRETERKTVPGYPAAAVAPGTSSGRAGNKKSRTRPSIISDRTSCQAEFPAALQNFRVLPRSCFLKSVTPAVRYFRRCIGLCPKIEQPLPFPLPDAYHPDVHRRDCGRSLSPGPVPRHHDRLYAPCAPLLVSPRLLPGSFSRYLMRMARVLHCTRYTR